MCVEGVGTLVITKCIVRQSSLGEGCSGCLSFEEISGV